MENMIKRAKPVEGNIICNNIGMAAKKSNVESGKIYKFYFLGVSKFVKRFIILFLKFLFKLPYHTVPVSFGKHQFTFPIG